MYVTELLRLKIVDSVYLFVEMRACEAVRHGEGLQIVDRVSSRDDITRVRP